VDPKEMEDLLAGPPFTDRIDLKTANQLLELARSPKPEYTDHLIKVGMTRGLRHPRWAVQAIESQLGQRFASQSVSLAEQSVMAAKQSVKVARWAALAAGLAAVAAVVDLVAGL
jgi:hypothetical protein